MAKSDVSRETIEAVQEALKKSVIIKDATTQGFSTTSGLNAYNLEAPARNLYPVITPIRNEMPRQGGGVGTAVNWKAITAINTTGLKPGVSEGSIGTVPSFTEKDHVASYKTLGYPNTLTEEATWASRGFDDPRALMTVQTLQTTMIGEERMTLGGNVTAVGAPTGVTAVDGTGSGPFSGSTAYDFGVSALTLFGYLAGSTGHASVDAPDESTAGTYTSYTSGSGKTAPTLSWNAVRGAVAYNVFIGTHSGTRYYAFTTGQTSITITNAVLAALPGSGNVANSADQTGDTLSFDGIIAQTSVSSGGGYWKDIAGATLTGDNAGGVVEIDAALKSLWDTSRVGPESMWVNSQQAQDITKRILANGSTTTMRVNLQAGAGGALQGGLVVDSYLNKFTSEPIKIRIHPDLPAGNVVMTTNRLPGWFPNSNVPSAWALDVRQEFYQREFAQTDRQYRIGVYVSEVLKGYFPAGSAVLAGVGAG